MKVNKLNVALDFFLKISKRESLYFFKSKAFFLKFKQTHAKLTINSNMNIFHDSHIDKFVQNINNDKFCLLDIEDNAFLYFFIIEKLIN
jgi:hypothetical protein